ncbi:MAG: hypothetical protein RMN51_01665 [Verrucomicrobiota bacterium]|nr:hypothetical protein [Limisphaera sp.]MDW8380806.1 hypothetical protein [Verrucomicrobiota bacterium]
MTPAEYAAYERAMGERVVEQNGVYWRQVRPFFFRPLLSFEPLDASAVRRPWLARWGGWQCVVRDQCQANAAMAFLLFREVRGYSLHSLEKKRRWEVRQAEKQFEVRRLQHVGELVAAHPCYLEFQSRTRYKYRADRVDPKRFGAWAEEVFRHPKVMVWGAYHANRIEAVSLAIPVEQTLLYSTFFATTDGLRKHVASLMLHVLRTWAQQRGDIAQVYVGLKKTGAEASVDQFYLQRGCEVVVQPAYCWVNPLAAWCLRRWRPDLWNRLAGRDLVSSVSSALVPQEG